MKLADFEIERDKGQAKCPVCGLWFKSLGLASHFHKRHNPNYQNMGTTGHDAWNKGLTKENNPIMAKVAKTLTGRTYPERITSATTGAKISKSMQKAHAEGRAHNIGSSRWNNEPSYPEKFFMRVIENEFEDKNVQREYPFGRFSLDFAWPHLQRAIEIDGEQHERFEKQRESDARKDKALTDAGWKVLRVKWKEMYADTKAQIARCKQFLTE